MPFLDHIFPAANNFTAGDNETAAFSGGSITRGEPFDQVMSRALSPRATNVPAASNRRQQTNYSSAHKWDSAEVNTSPSQPAPLRAVVDSPTAAADSSIPVNTKAGTQTGGTAGKDVNPPVPSGASNLPDVAQNTSILLLAPTLAAYLLKSLVPEAALKSEATNLPVAAVLPAGVEGQRAAAAAATLPGVDAAAKPSAADAILQLESAVPQKSATPKNAIPPAAPAQTENAETSGLSAAAPIISELAGAGDTSLKKVGALSPDEVLPDDPGQPMAPLVWQKSAGGNPP